MILSARDVRAPGVMRNLDLNGNLQFETAIRIPAGARVDVEYGPDFTATGNAMYCQRQGNVFLVGVRLRQNRRREPRFEAAGPATIAAMDSADVVQAEVRHVSLSGIGLSTTRPFEPGAMVRVETRSWFAFGEVRHCTAVDETNYSAGIVFVTESFDKS